MAGKTGTAQKIGRKGSGRSVDPRSLPYHLRHQALFVGYAPADTPRIAIAVSVEHGGYGGSTAAPIARKVFDAWLTGTMPVPEEGVVRSPQGGASLEWPLPGMDEEGKPLVGRGGATEPAGGAPAGAAGRTPRPAGAPPTPVTTSRTPTTGAGTAAPAPSTPPTQAQAQAQTSATSPAPDATAPPTRVVPPAAGPVQR
jgi:penicillin-binding protein 2